MRSGAAGCAEILQGLHEASFGLAAEGENALQLIGPGNVEERVHDAVGEGALLHAAFDDAGAADGPEGVDDGADALDFKLGAGFELEHDGSLEILKLGEVLGGHEDLGVGGGRLHESHKVPFLPRE